MRCAMPPTVTERYAVVSCHVERPLDDRVWAAFAALQERPPGGISRRGADPAARPEAGEHDERALARARPRGGRRGPLGHHTHFTGPTHARPTGGDPGGRVRGRELAPRARARPDALLRRRLVHGRRRWRRPARRSGTWTARRGRRARRISPAGRLGGARRAGADRPRRPTLAAVPTTHGAGDVRAGRRAAGPPGARPRVLPRHRPRRRRRAASSWRRSPPRVRRPAVRSRRVAAARARPRSWSRGTDVARGGAADRPA